MDPILDFIKATAPWVVMGVALALYFVRSAAKKKDHESQDKKQGGDHSAEGMSLGMCFGVAIGAALGAALNGSIAMGVPLGMLLGILLGPAIGSCVQKKQEDGEE